MEFTLFGLVLMGYIVYIFCKNKKINQLLKKMIILTAICSLNIRMGYVLKIGNNVFGYSSFLIYITGLVSLLYIVRKRTISKQLSSSVLCMFLVLVIGAFGNMLLPYKEKVVIGNWTEYVQGKNVEFYLSEQSLKMGYYLVLFFVGLILIASYSFFKESDFQDILSITIKISKLSIVVGYVEYITKNIFHSQIITNLFVYIFGSYGAQQNFLISRGGFFAVQGATKESSMFTTVIFYISIMLIVDYAKTKAENNKKWLLACMVLLVINPAMSSIVYLCILGVIIFLYRNIWGFKRVNKVRNDRVLLLIIIVVAGGWFGVSQMNVLLRSSNYIVHRIGVALQQLQIIISGVGGVMYSSEAIRFSGIIYDIKLFARRPLFGFGLGSISCNSGIVTFLVNSGIIGFGAWYHVIHKYMNKKNSLSEIIFTMCILILPNIFLNDYETIFCIAIPIILRCFVCLNVSNIPNDKMSLENKEE